MKRLLTLAILAVLWALPVLAMESAPVSSPRAVVTLVSETDAIQPGQPFRIGLNLRMADGWHTYWKNPGDAGAPPEFFGERNVFGRVGGARVVPVEAARERADHDTVRCLNGDTHERAKQEHIDDRDQ